MGYRTLLFFVAISVAIFRFRVRQSILHLLLSRDAAKSLALSSSSLVVLVRIVVAEFVVPITPRRRDCDGNNFLFSTTTGAPTPRPAPECFARARTKRGSARRPHLLIIILLRVKAASLAKVVARVTYYYVRIFFSFLFCPEV